MSDAEGKVGTAVSHICRLYLKFSALRAENCILHESSDHARSYFLREIVLKAHMVRAELSSEEFLHNHIVPLVQIILRISFDNTIRDIHHQQPLIEEMLTFFNIEIQCESESCMGIYGESYFLRIIYDKVLLSEHKVLFHQVTEEASVKRQGFFHALRLLLCSLWPTQKSKIDSLYYTIYSGIDLTIPKANTIQNVKHFLASTLLSTKPISYQNLLQSQDPKSCPPFMYRLNNPFFPFPVRFVRNKALTEAKVKNLEKYGLSKTDAIENMSIFHWLKEVPDFNHDEHSDFFLRKLFDSYDLTDRGINCNNVYSVIPHHLSDILSSTKGTLHKELLLHSDFEESLKRNIHRLDTKALFQPAKKFKIDTPEEDNKEAEPEPILQKVPEAEILNLAPLPEIDFALTGVNLTSSSFEQILKAWLLLYSSPKKIKLSRMDFSLFTQAICDSSDTPITAESLKKLLHLLGHKFNASSTYLGFFRNVQYNVVREAINYLKERLNPKKVAANYRNGKCFVCKLGNTNVGCCICQKVFHARCINMKSIPDTAWKCASCTLSISAPSSASSLSVLPSEIIDRKFENDAMETLCLKAQKLFRTMAVYGQDIKWSKLSIQERVDLFDVLYNLALQQQSIKDHFEELHWQSAKGSTSGNHGAVFYANGLEDDTPIFCMKPLGFDRYRRMYWRVPTDERIFVQSFENSLAWESHAQRTVNASPQRPSLMIDEESCESDTDKPQSDESTLIKTVGWGVIQARNLPLLVESLAPQGVLESSLLRNIKTYIGITKENPVQETEPTPYPMTRNRALSPLQRYENLLS